MLDLGTSPGNVTISQRVENLAVGALYRLSFSIADTVGDNAVRVQWGGVTIGTFKGGKQMETWVLNVTAQQAATALTFAEVGRVDNTGTYLDNVRLSKIGLSDAERAEAAKAEAERIAAEKAAAEKAEAEKAAALAAAKLAEEKAAAEAAEKAAAEKAAAELAAKLEAEKVAAEALAKAEADAAAKLAAEKAAAEAAEKAAAQQLVAEKLAAEKLEAEKIAAEKAAIAAAEKAAQTITVVETSKTTAEFYAGKSVKEIVGTDGNDYIVSSAAGAKVDGGKGFDTLSFMDQGGAKGVFVDFDKGYAENTFGNVDSFSSIERVVGSYGDDRMYARWFAATLDGGDGNDYLQSDTGKGMLFGGGGNDRLSSGWQNGHANSGVGDTMVGGQGDDIMANYNGRLAVVDYGLDGGVRAVSVNLKTGFAEDSWGNTDTLMNIGIVKGTDKGDWMMGGDKASIIFDGGAGTTS